MKKVVIETRIEQARGCGYRKPGGIYLVGPSGGRDCGRLPVPLTVCPCCSAGIKPSRGWTWIAGNLLQHACTPGPGKLCANCFALKDDWTNQEKIGLIWIGESFYATPAAFVAEAAKVGVSRRLANLPLNFKIGQWVALAHRKAILKWKDGQPEFVPGVFMMFKPTAIEYVVKGDESPGRLEDLSNRGFTLVRVKRDVDAQTKIEDALVNFEIKYETKTEPPVIRIQSMRAVSRDVARDQFKKSFPQSKIISIK